MNRFITFACFVAAVIACKAEPVTIDYCVDRALDHYPSVRKYDLLTATNDVALSDIARGWLPRIALYGQTTMQNAVPSFPEALSAVMAQMGADYKGLGRLQYKVGADLTQTIWDGGVARQRRRVQNAQHEVQREALGVELYQVRQRVESYYFAALLCRQQIKSQQASVDMLRQNLLKVQAMVRNGVATQSDADMLEGRLLVMEQNISIGQSALHGYIKALSLFVGENLEDAALELPSAQLPATFCSQRPELKVFERRKAATRAALKLQDTSVMPRFALFAQTYYGYPGFDYFKSMSTKEMTFNAIGGVKVSWQLDALYTRGNNRQRALTELANIDAERKTFIFNSNVQIESALEKINGLRDVMAKDNDIVSLMNRVRKSAESQVDNGIIDATDFLAKVNDETQATITASLHEIELVKEIYNLKYILNQ